MGTSQSHNLKSSPNWSAAKRAMTSLANGTDNKPASNAKFFGNSGKLLFVPYTKDFGRITQFWGNDLATVLYATFCSDMLSSHSFSKQR